jgi:hypothetical protein
MHGRNRSSLLFGRVIQTFGAFAPAVITLWSGFIRAVHG